MHLQLAVDNTSGNRAAVPVTAFAYSDLLDERRAELERDLDYYSQRLRDASLLTGNNLSLRDVYEAHARKLRELLAHF